MSKGIAEGIPYEVVKYDKIGPLSHWAPLI